MLEHVYIALAGIIQTPISKEIGVFWFKTKTDLCHFMRDQDGLVLFHVRIEAKI